MGADRIETQESSPAAELDKLHQSTLKHGPKFLNLTVPQRQWLSKIHHNLGHPNVNKLQAVLKSQGFDDALVQGLADFRCSTCHELQEPRICSTGTPR